MTWECISQQECSPSWSPPYRDERLRYPCAGLAILFWMIAIGTSGCSTQRDAQPVSDDSLVAGQSITYRARPNDAGVILIRELGPTTSCGRVAKVAIRGVSWRTPWAPGTREIHTIMSIAALRNSATGLLEGSGLEVPSDRIIAISDDFALAEQACLSSRADPNRFVTQL